MKILLPVFLFFGLYLPTVAQRFTDIIVEADTAGKDITYGTMVSFKYYTLNKKNKEKQVPFRKVNQYMRIDVTGAEWDSNSGNLFFPRYMTDKNQVAAKISFTSTDPDIVLNQAFDIKMNFRGNFVVNYKGSTGVMGSSGDSKGTPLLLRDGKLGGDGSRGGNGGKGSSVTVRCKREMDDVFKREVLFVYVTDDSLLHTHIYRCMNPAGEIRISVSGGDGGTGGNGGDGGNGKNGSVSEKNSLSPGDGGNGGKGGDGGNGGAGGKITVVAHTNCADILGNLRIENGGGNPGMGGKGGDGGKSGKPDTGQTEGKKGLPGAMGNPGVMGVAGPIFSLRVEDF